MLTGDIESRIMEEKKKFKILCIDGGGIKGLYSAQVLAKFEESFNTRLSDHFDLICGTSTGGIIALAASAKIPMSEVVKFYEVHGPKIFSSVWKYFGRFGTSILALKQALIRSKYSQKYLRSALISVFGNKKIKESWNLLCIPAYNLSDAKPRIFKKDYGTLDQDDNKTYVDVALATAAAPTYLPIKEIEKLDYVDGGLYANNPVIVGLTEYLFKWANRDMFDGVNILSISSCEKSLGWSPKGRRLSFLKWSDYLFDCYSHGQALSDGFFIQQLINSDSLKFKLNIVRVANNPLSGQQEKYVSMDNASKHSIKILNQIGKATGVLYKEKKEVKAFFETKKTINPEDYGKQ